MRAQLLLVAAAATLATAPSLGQQDFSGVEIQTIELADGLFMLVGQGGNIVLSTGDDGAFIVDTQFAGLTDKIQAAIDAAGGGDVRFVFNTHHHGDHTGGNANFNGAGATIMAHDNVQLRLSSPQTSARDGSTTPPAPDAAIPVLTYPTRMTFHWNGNTMNMFHVPNAHTDGDSIVHFTNFNVFHMGDTFVNGAYPFIDVGSAGSLDGFIEAARSVLARSNAETQIVPGHGALAAPDDLREFLDMLETVRERLQSLIDQGNSEEAVVAANPTADLDAQWGGGFMNGEMFTRFAYRSLTN